MSRVREDSRSSTPLPCLQESWWQGHEAPSAAASLSSQPVGGGCLGSRAGSPALERWSRSKRRGLGTHTKQTEAVKWQERTRSTVQGDRGTRAMERGAVRGGADGGSQRTAFESQLHLLIPSNCWVPCDHFISISSPQLAHPCPGSKRPPHRGVTGIT